MNQVFASLNRAKPILLLVWLLVIIAVAKVLNHNSINVFTVGGRLGYTALGCAMLLNIVLGFYWWWRIETRGNLAQLMGSFSAAIVSLGTLASLMLASESVARLHPVYDSYGLNPASEFIWPELNLPPNSLGYRDREPGPKRGPRILVLGDSYTEGAGVRRYDRFTNILENIYREATDPELEVFNAGRSGMDTFDELSVLESSGDYIDPDVVVVAYVLNDADSQGLRPRKTKPPAIEWFFLRKLNSYLFYYFYSKGRKRVPDAANDPILMQHLENSSGWQLSQNSMQKIVAWSNDREIPAVLIALPIFFDYGERYRPTLDQVVQAAASIGFRSFNTIDDFDGRLSELAISYEDPHPGREAHRIIATSLHNHIGRPWDISNRE